VPHFIGFVEFGGVASPITPPSSVVEKHVVVCLEDKRSMVLSSFLFYAFPIVEDSTETMLSARGSIARLDSTILETSPAQSPLFLSF
jgi:hypothetical protein